MLFTFKERSSQKVNLEIFEILKMCQSIISEKFNGPLVWAYGLVEYKHGAKKSSVAKKLYCKFNRNNFPHSLESIELDYFKLKLKIWNSDL